MIEDYRGLAVFVVVADAGSFSQAGRQLKLSTSVVSHHINKLEEKLGVSLFFRSTRSLSLTPEGQTILNAARRMVAAGEEALDALADTSDQPVGALRVTTPAFGENSDVHQGLWSFAREHPFVAILLQSSDEQVDLVKDGFDVAIRLGRLKDSALKTRKIGEFHRMLVGTPEYLSSVPPIRTADDLQHCQYISVVMLPDQMTLVRGTETIEVEQENIRLEVNSVAGAVSAVKAHLGIQVLPVSEIEDEVKNGTLVHILPEWEPPIAGVYAVWPEIGTQKKLTRRFIDFLIEYGRKKNPSR